LIGGRNTSSPPWLLALGGPPRASRLTQAAGPIQIAADDNLLVPPS